MTVKQWLLQIPSYPMQVLEVLLMQFLPAANILKKALEFLQLVNTDTKVRDWLYYGVEGVKL